MNMDKQYREKLHKVADNLESLHPNISYYMIEEIKLNNAEYILQIWKKTKQDDLHEIYDKLVKTFIDPVNVDFEGNFKIIKDIIKQLRT